MSPMDGGNRPKPSCVPPQVHSLASDASRADKNVAPVLTSHKPGGEGGRQPSPEGRSSSRSKAQGWIQVRESVGRWSCRMLEAAPVCAYTCCRAIRSMLPLDESSLEGLAEICSYISG